MSKMKLINTSQQLIVDDFAEINSRFNIELPSSLVEHYLRNNGGIPSEYRMYYIPKGKLPAEADEICLKGFYPIKYKIRPNQSTLEEDYAEYCERQKLFDRHEYVPFGYDISGYPFLMDFKCQKIYLLNRDNIDEDGNDTIEFVADSLDDFIEGLISPDDYESNV